MQLSDTIREWLMIRYCPDYLEKMPEDEPGQFYARAIITTGYWGNKRHIVAEEEVQGQLLAYKTARWLALKAQWRYPEWLYRCGIHYGVQPRPPVAVAQDKECDHQEGIPA